MMPTSPQSTSIIRTQDYSKSSLRKSWEFTCCLFLLTFGILVAGCDKAKELADNAVNQVKKDFGKANEDLKKAANPDVKGNKKKDIAFDRPKADSDSPNNTNKQSATKITYEAFLRLGPSNVEDRHLLGLASDDATAAKVTQLDLSSARITAKGLEALSKFSNLQRLELTRTAACVGNMHLIGKVTSLKSLELDFIPLSDIDFKGIAGLVNLEEINISSTRITDEGFRCFQKMPKLRFMLMDRMSLLQGKGFKYVNKNSIQEIRANGSSIGLYAFQSLGGSESLEILWLNGARVTDAAMQGIGRCPNLKDIRLEKNDLTNKGISYLKNHKSLEKIVLAGNRRLNNQALGHLTKTKTLKMVNVHDTLCSQEVEAEFLKYVPGCKLIF